MTDERALMERVAGEGLLGSYLQYARTLTAAPLAYHVATGLCLIAGAVGSKVSFWGAGDTEYWPNQYTLLLGPSGAHKTTAMNIGLGILRAAAPGVVYSDQFSQEAFIAALRERPNRLLAVEEFATLLADMERSYMVGLKETLTKLYDPRQEFVRSLRGEGEITIGRPSITILAASTPDWLVSHLKEVDFISGFMPRFLIWPSGLKEPDAGSLVRGDQLAKNALVRQLGALAHMPRATVEFEPPSIRAIDAFVKERRLRQDTEFVPRELEGLLSRCGNYAAKIATLLMLADEGPQTSYRVPIEVTRRAVSLMDWLLDRAQALFEQQIVFEPFEREAQRILALIPDEGVSWSDALKRSRKPSEQFRKIVETLKQRGQVREDSRGTATKPGRYLYRLYPELHAEAEKDCESFTPSVGKDSRNGQVVRLPVRIGEGLKGGESGPG